MFNRRITIEELKQQPLEEILQEIADQQVVVVVLLSDGKELIIEPKPCLKPLPELEGRVPRGWKDSVYG